MKNERYLFECVRVEFRLNVCVMLKVILIIYERIFYSRLLLDSL